MNVAVFSLGSAIRYRKSKIKKIDGSYDYWITLWALARCPDITNIYVISKSDYTKASEDDIKELDPRGIIVDIRAKHSGAFKGTSYLDSPDHQYEKISLLEKVISAYCPQIDFGIGFNSQGFDTKYMIPGISKIKRPPYTYNRVFEMALNYTSPLVHYLNISNLPWFMVSIDYRYLHSKMEKVHMANLPRLILSHHKQKIEWVGIEKEEKDAQFVSRTVEATSSGFEIMGVIGQNPLDVHTEKPNKFTVLVSQNCKGFQPSDLRYTLLKDWVIRPDKNCESAIYGRWDEEYMKEYPQFKGFLENIDEVFNGTRYTLAMPNDAGWVTYKHLEMLVKGILPFCPPMYDTDYSFVPKNHPLRVSTPEEMYSKMDYYDAHESERIELLKDLYDKCLDGIEDGKAFIRVLNRAFKRSSLDLNLTENQLYFLPYIPSKKETLREAKEISLF